MTSSITYDLPADAAQHRIAVNADFIISELCAIRQHLRPYLNGDLVFDSVDDALDSWSAQMEDLFNLIEE